MGTTSAGYRGLKRRYIGPVMLCGIILLLLCACFTFFSSNGTGANTGPQTHYVGFSLEGGMTLQEAIDGSSDGDTILLAPGLYNASAVIDKAITIKGTPQGTPVLQPAKSAPMLTVGSKGVTLSGLTFSGMKRSGAAIYAKDSPDLRIDGCVFLECSSAVELEQCQGLRQCFDYQCFHIIYEKWRGP